MTFQQNRSLTAKFRFIGNTIIDPDGIVWEKQTEQQASKPQDKPEVTPTQTDSKMTNNEVIQLVTAGLSEQVIITSIRQAPTKDFDLTPTGLIALKKAGVSDAVIVVMQERGTITATTSGAAQAQTGQSRDNGTRFIGYWKGIRSGDYMLISKDGDKYIIREPSAGVFPCELINGSLKSGTLIGNVDFIESSGHITWRGIEWQKLPQTSR